MYNNTMVNAFVSRKGAFTSRKGDLLYNFYVSRIRADAPLRRADSSGYYQGVAEKLGISYFTLMGKLNGHGKFTARQYQVLKELYSESK